MAGELNWYSKEIRDRFLKRHRLLARLRRDPALSLNRWVRNREIEISEDGDEYLQLFYELNDGDGIYVCGSGELRKAATLSGQKQAKFELELTLSGSNFAKKVETFKATVLRGNFQLARG
jgi:hypothetical protein